MRSGEKHFEQLSESEKDIFGLCGDIIKWSDPPRLRHYPGVIELREEATRLYGELSKMDYVNDDRYYKVSAEAERLRGKFNVLQQEIENRKTSAEKNPLVKINIEEGMSVGEIMTLVREKIESGVDVMIKKFWIPESPSYEGDNIDVEIVMPPVSTGYCERIWAHENFPAYYLEGEPILQRISEEGFGRPLSVSVHEHEDRDQYELIGRAQSISLEKALKIVEEIVRLISEGRRVRPSKKGEYDQAIEDAWFDLQHPDW